MSDLRNSVISVLDDAVEKFSQDIAKKYNLNKDDLFAIWKSGATSSVEPAVSQNSGNTSPVQSETTNSDSKFSRDELNKMKKPELVKLCKENKVKTTGKKDDLVERLMNVDNSPAKQVPTKKQTILQSLNSTIPTISIRRNKHGNYEHPETHLVFDKINKVVFGMQNDNGTVDPLTDEHIDLCNKFKFKFILPENLNKSQATSVDTKKIVADEDDEDDEDDDDILEDDDLIEDDDDLGEFYESGGED